MDTDIKRRTFLKSVGVGAGVAVAGPAIAVAQGAEGDGGAIPTTVYGVLVDTRRCVNCKSCQIACKSWWDNETDPTTFKTDFTPQTWCYVGEHESGSYDAGDANVVFTKRQCMHCEDPTCVSVCPQSGTETPAMQKLSDGPVVLDHDNCIRCLQCVNNCPFGVPRFDTDQSKVLKCVFCYGRTRDGRAPACVDTCPTGALQFDTIENIQALADQAEADGYPVAATDPAGNGTSWIYVFEKGVEVQLTK